MPITENNRSVSVPQSIVQALDTRNNAATAFAGFVVLAYDELKKYLDSYSSAEVRIIKNAAKAYRVIEKGSEVVPINFRLIEKPDYCFAPYKLYAETEVEESRFENDSRILSQCRAAVQKLTKYNKEYESYILFRGNSRAIKFVFDFLIQTLYALTKSNLSSDETLKEIRSYQTFVEMINNDDYEKCMHENEHSNAAAILSDTARYLKEMCDIVEDILLNRNAKDHLVNMGSKVSNLVNYGFEYILNIAALRDAEGISLSEIKKEQSRCIALGVSPRENLRPYINVDKNPTRFEVFINKFSNSLNTFIGETCNVNNINLVTNAEQKQVIMAEFSKDDCGIYKPIRKFKSNANSECFMNLYVKFASDLENLAYLYPYIKLAAKVAGTKGDLTYFIVMRHTSHGLVSQIRAIINSLYKGLNKLNEIASQINGAIKHKKISGDEWSNNYRHFVNIKVALDEIIKAIIVHCTKLLSIREQFTKETIKHIENAKSECVQLSNGISKFNRHLIDSGYQLSEIQEDLPAINSSFGLFSLVGSMNDGASATKQQPSLLKYTFLFDLTDRKFNPQWFFLQADELSQFDVKIFEEFYKKMEKDIKIRVFKSYLNTENSLHENLDDSHLYLYIEKYNQLDDYLKFCKKSDEIADLSYSLRVELAHRQITLLRKLIESKKISEEALLKFHDNFHTRFSKSVKGYKETSRDSKHRIFYKDFIGFWCDSMKIFSLLHTSELFNMIDNTATKELFSHWKSRSPNVITIQCTGSTRDSQSQQNGVSSNGSRLVRHGISHDSSCADRIINSAQTTLADTRRSLIDSEISEEERNDLEKSITKDTIISDTQVVALAILGKIFHQMKWYSFADLTQEVTDNISEYATKESDGYIYISLSNGMITYYANGLKSIESFSMETWGEEKISIKDISDDLKNHIIESIKKREMAREGSPFRKHIADISQICELTSDVIGQVENKLNPGSEGCIFLKFENDTISYYTRCMQAIETMPGAELRDDGLSANDLSRYYKNFILKKITKREKEKAEANPAYIPKIVDGLPVIEHSEKNNAQISDSFISNDHTQKFVVNYGKEFADAALKKLGEYNIATIKKDDKLIQAVSDVITECIYWGGPRWDDVCDGSICAESMTQMLWNGLSCRPFVRGKYAPGKSTPKVIGRDAFFTKVETQVEAALKEFPDDILLVKENATSDVQHNITLTH